jgi:spore coat polysaccharide biosynthesis predicted glycosyltransferase SpsG
MTARPVLVIPAFEKGRGGGHLVRSLALVRELRALGREAYLYPPDIFGEDGVDIAGPFDPAWILKAVQKPEEKKWGLIIVDRFKTSPEEVQNWSTWGPLIGLDEGGLWRDRFDFLLDLLPGPPGISPPNMTSPEFLPLPKNRRLSFFIPSGEKTASTETRSPAPLKILVSFGAEDPAGLSLATAQALVNPGVEVTLILGGLNKNAVLQTQAERSGIRVLKNIGELREKLSKYELLVTHFGLTAFEALHARVPVLLVSPGPYHEKLGRWGGFISAGTGKKGMNRLPKLL